MKLIVEYFLLADILVLWGRLAFW